MRAGALLWAICQVLLRMLSIRFASSPLALRVYRLGMFAMSRDVNRSRLSQSRVLLHVVLRWRCVFRASVKSIVSDVHAA